MSVASANPFAILGAVEDSSRPSSPGPATQKKEASASQTTRAQSKKGPASRGGRYYARGGKTREPTQEGQEEAPVGDESTQKNDGEGRGRGRGRGRGDRGRGGRGRTFDRHSATGKTDSDKKVHQGWGGDEAGTELKAEEAGNTDAQAEGVAAATDGWDPVPIDPWGAPPATDPWGAPPAEGDIAPAPEDEKVDDDRKPREREFDEEDNTISYDEYLAQLKDTTTSSIPKLEGVRGANEGAEEDVWGNVIEHKRNEDEEAYYVGKSKGSNKVRAEKKEKVFIEIDARFERPSRGGRGRGGDRGRGRGGRGGKGRGNVNGAPTSEVDVADETAFPSLS
ncbi:hypothetical protein DFH94DRAFT_738084 [Russula ochroleuca]|uniref:Hyaluronan/mRNA-binding protein domain-containing protein n=1 Tax=Russula ochroleuca TaxID=152965 RepID=A0A9P5TA71_9AGAM|nr:hypothetical protein DFH94DRAFT_738084 [Russula ochroleuca]